MASSQVIYGANPGIAQENHVAPLVSLVTERANLPLGRGNSSPKDSDSTLCSAFLILPATQLSISKSKKKKLLEPCPLTPVPHPLGLSWELRNAGKKIAAGFGFHLVNPDANCSMGDFRSILGKKL